MPENNTPTKVKVPDGERISELWAAVKTLLAGKVDLSQLEDYPSDTEMQEAIADALSDYTTVSEVNEAVDKVKLTPISKDRLDFILAPITKKG